MVPFLLMFVISAAVVVLLFAHSSLVEGHCRCYLKLKPTTKFKVYASYLFSDVVTYSISAIDIYVFHLHLQYE